MTELDWHRCTVQEEEGAGYLFILDVSPGYTSDEAAEYKGAALVRTGKTGWNWWARSLPRDKSKNVIRRDILGEAEFRDEAIEDGLRALDELMKEYTDIESGIEVWRK